MRRLVAVMGLSLVVSAAASATDFPVMGSLDTAARRTLVMRDGVRRSYLIQPVAAVGLFPVVILLHGGTQRADAVWTRTSLPTLGKRERFIVVAPQGVGNHWNDGRGSVIARDKASTADDVGFLRALIEELVRNEKADPQAVFLAGISNGGFMTMHFACLGATELRAAANLISDLPVVEAADCHPGKKLPWLSLNGTEDPIIPFQGQAEGAGRRALRQPALLSADATFTFWADRAGCGKTARSERLPGSNPSSWAERRERTGCAGGGGATSVQYVLHGAGHTTPNLREGPVIRLLGGSNQDVDTGELLWNFFRSTLKTN